jgi:hypothetical protein
VTTERRAGGEPTSRTEEDRVVSRRVDNPTAAGPEDERAYHAADTAPDTGPGGDGPASGGHGSTTERAEHDLDASDESEPTRSE